MFEQVMQHDSAFNRCCGNEIISININRELAILKILEDLRNKWRTMAKEIVLFDHPDGTEYNNWIKKGHNDVL